MKDLNLNNFKLETVHSEKILIVTLDRPPVNALDMETYKEFSKVIEYVSEVEEISCILLQSTGNVFSAGADIKEIGDASPQYAARRRAALRKSSTDIYNCPVPIVSAIQGGAIGAGAIFAS